MAKMKKPTKKMMNQQERFCQFVSLGKPLAHAHTLAGYAFTTKKNRANEACRMARIPHIAARIKELKAEVADEFSYTRTDAFGELVEVQNIARGGVQGEGNAATLIPANPAVMAKVIDQKVKLAGIEPPTEVKLTVEAMTYTIEKEK